MAAHGLNRHPSSKPPGRVGANLTYDAAARTVLLFGGSNGPQSLNDTWTWDGSVWHQEKPGTRPPARQGASIAYDESMRVSVLFGGQRGR